MTKTKPFPSDFNLLLTEIEIAMNKIIRVCDPDKEAFLLTHELRDCILDFQIRKSNLEPESTNDMLDEQERFYGAHYDECTGD